MPQYAATIPPSSLSFIGVAQELAAGSPVAPTSTIRPYGSAYDFEDTPVFIPDEGVRAMMGSLWGETLGPEQATWAFGGPAYLTSDCYLLDNLLGDLSTTANGFGGSLEPLTYPLSVGSTQLSVSSSLGPVVTGSIIEISDPATANEVVVATAGSSDTTVFFTGNPCRFPHSTSTAEAFLVTAATNYTHTFALYNDGTGQPPTHTLTDYSGLTAGTGARYYPGAVVAGFEFSGDAQGMLSYKTSGFSWLSTPAAATPIASAINPAPLANWRTTISVGGSQIYTAADWTASFARQMVGYWGPLSQTPTYFARGDLTLAGTLAYTVPQDETPLLQMLAGTPTSLTITATNGLSGASERAMTLQMSAAQFVTAKLGRGYEVLSYADDYQAVNNTTDVGGSGGAGPATLTITNNFPTF